MIIVTSVADEPFPITTHTLGPGCRAFLARWTVLICAASLVVDARVAGTAEHLCCIASLQHTKHQPRLVCMQCPASFAFQDKNYPAQPPCGRFCLGLSGLARKLCKGSGYQGFVLQTSPGFAIAKQNGQCLHAAMIIWESHPPTCTKSTNCRTHALSPGCRTLLAGWAVST